MSDLLPIVFEPNGTVLVGPIELTREEALTLARTILNHFDPPLFGEEAPTVPSGAALRDSRKPPT